MCDSEYACISNENAISGQKMHSAGVKIVQNTFVINENALFTIPEPIQMPCSNAWKS